MNLPLIWRPFTGLRKIIKKYLLHSPPSYTRKPEKTTNKIPDTVFENSTLQESDYLISWLRVFGKYDLKEVNPRLKGLPSQESFVTLHLRE